MNKWPTISIFLTAVIVACAGGGAQQPVSLVDVLANAVTAGILQSKDLEKSLPFEVYYPYDMFFRVGTSLLKKAGINDPRIAKVAAEAADKVAEHLGKLTSEVYVNTLGNEVAKFLDKSGLLTETSVVYFAFMVVTAVELEACLLDADDAESFTTAVVYGLFQTFNAIGLVSYDNMKRLFHVFSDELLSQAGIEPKPEWHHHKTPNPNKFHHQG